MSSTHAGEEATQVRLHEMFTNAQSNTHKRQRVTRSSSSSSSSSKVSPAKASKERQHDNVALAGTAAAAEGTPLSAYDASFLHTFSQTNRFRLGYPTSLKLTRSGTLLYLRAASSTCFTHNLYALDIHSQETVCLATAETLLNGAEDRLSVEEAAMRERMRVAAKGLTSFLICPNDEYKVLIPFNGQLYLCNRARSSEQPATDKAQNHPTVTQLTHAASPPMCPQFSPDGTMIAFVRDGDLVVLDIHSEAEWKLTNKSGGTRSAHMSLTASPASGTPSSSFPTSSSSSSPTTSSASASITNGLADFIAAEEMSRFQGFWWAPDSTMIAYQQTDTADMEVMHIADPAHPTQAANSFPYPRAGKKNARIRLGIIRVDRQKHVLKKQRSNSSSVAASPIHSRNISAAFNMQSVQTNSSSSSITSPQPLSTATPTVINSTGTTATAPAAASTITSSTTTSSSSFLTVPPILDTADDDSVTADLTDSRTGRLVYSPSSHSKNFGYGGEGISDATIWVQWDHDKYPYMADVVWSTIHAPLTVVVQSRDQHDLALLTVETVSGATSTLLTEHDDCWLNLDPSSPLWLHNGQHFLVSTERTGSYQLALYTRTGKLVRMITPPELGYRRMLCHLGDHLYLHASPNPTQQHVYRIPLHLDQPPQSIIPSLSDLTPMTHSEGMHRAVIHPTNLEYWVHQRSSLTEGPAVFVRPLLGATTASSSSPQPADDIDQSMTATDKVDEDGEYLIRLDHVAHPLPYESRVRIETVEVSVNDLALNLQMNYEQTQQTEAVSANTKTFTMYGAIIPPVSYDPAEDEEGEEEEEEEKGEEHQDEQETKRKRKGKQQKKKKQRRQPKKKYPVILSVYGGPHHQCVVTDYHFHLLNHFFASHDFFVITMDNRGTPSRGRDWERSIHLHLATVPLKDQIAGLRAFAAKYPAMDMDRVGVQGWSFGGTMAALSVLCAPHVFHSGLAGAPVTIWSDYDTHYTERYLGMPKQEASAYAASSPLTYASQLSRPLLLLHGTSDDNVYFSHSLLFNQALFTHGKECEFLPLINFTHMVNDPIVNQRLYERVLSFFIRTVKNRNIKE